MRYKELIKQSGFMIAALFFSIPVVFVSALLFRADVSQGGWSASIEVRNTERVERKGELVSGGMPFPLGALYDPADLRVSTEDGVVIPSQAHQLGISWPDGSIRWALVQFQADVPAEGVRAFVVFVGDLPCEMPDQAVTVAEDPERILVENGRLRMVFDREGAPSGRVSGFPGRVELWDESGEWKTMLSEHPEVVFKADREHMTREQFEETGLPINTLWSFGLGGVWQHADEAWESPLHEGKIFCRHVQGGDPVHWTPWHDWSDRIERGIDYSTYFSGPVEFKVEESGPVRAVIAFSRPGVGKEGEVGYSGRVYLTAGAKQFRVEFTIENYEEETEVPAQGMRRNLVITNTKHIREFNLGFTPEFDVKSASFGMDGGRLEVDVLDGMRPNIFQRAERQALVSGLSPARSVDFAEGRRADGWIEVSGEHNSMVIAHQFFSEIYPKSLGYDSESKRLYTSVWPVEFSGPGYPFGPGRIRTYEFEIGFRAAPEEASATARMPLRPFPGAEHFSRSGAAHPVLPIDDEAFPSFREYVERSLDRWVNERLLYGDIHFGDQPGWSRYSTASGYHGVSNELFMFYLSSGDPEIFRLAEASVKHDIEIDRCHWGERAGYHQSGHTRDQNHMSVSSRGGITTWNFGDVDYYFLTGRRRVLDTIAVSADFLIRQSPMQPGGFALDRQTSLPYKHVAYMYEAIGDERAVAELYPEAFVAEKYPHRNDSIGFKRSLEIIETMKRVTEHLENLFKTEAALKVPFMISYAPEGLYRYWRLTGDESAREGLVASADFLYTHPDNVMPSGVLRYTGDVRHALGRNPSQYWLVWFDEVDLPGARVYQATGDRRYLKYLTAALDWRLLLMGIADYRYGFGSTLPSTLWLMREGGMTEQHLRSPRTDIDYTKALEIMKPVALQQLEQSGSVPSSYHSLAAEVGRILVITGRPEDAIEWLEPWRALAIGRRIAMVESVIKRAEEEIEASR